MLWLRPRRPAGAWYVTLAMAVALTGFSFLAAPWGWFGLGVRYAMAALFISALIASIRRPPYEEAQTEGSPLLVLVKVLITLLFGAVAVGVLTAHAVPAGAVDLAFPLRGGAYLVQHGGSDSAANIHSSQGSQRYAVDLVELNGAGMRARGIYPRDLSRYEIFGENVFSPCSGTVVNVVDGLPDNQPGAIDAKQPLGNRVAIRCGDVEVTLAHLQRGSVAVRKGSAIASGSAIGKVGSSGDASEPHLHIHAERNGVAVPARFDGRWLVRNAIVRR